MPIINADRLQKKTKLKVEISHEIYEKMEEYCAWANIADMGYFVEEAVAFIFAKDRDWKAYCKPPKRAYNKKKVIKSPEQA